MRSLTVVELFDAAVAESADREAIVFAGDRRTYAELDSDVRRAATVLAGSGVRRGTAVAGSADNCIQLLVAFLAVMRLGAVWVGINTALAAQEKSVLARHARARVLVGNPEAAAELEQLPDIRTVFRTGPDGGDWDDAVTRAAEYRVAHTIDPFAPAAIAYTSGTTGRPKGVVHSQHNLSLPPAYLATTSDFDRSSRPGTCLPLTILNVIVVTVLPALFSGAGCVVLPRPEAASIAAAVRRERITTMTIPPPTLHDLSTSRSVDPADLSTLDRPRTGGAGLAEFVRQMFHERFGSQLIATYGLTEVPTVVTQEQRSDVHVPGASGRPLPYLDVRIVGEDGRALAANETGEICIGANRTGAWADAYRPMLGYHRRPAATRHVLQEGYLHTGDIGLLDGDGNLFVHDRKGSLILRGGANVYPAEVERVLAELPGVADVAVVPVPDVRLGERVGAVVVRRAGSSISADDLRDHATALLARYKVPEIVRFVSSLPRNAMGKVLRSEAAILAANATRIDTEQGGADDAG